MAFAATRAGLSILVLAAALCGASLSATITIHSDRSIGTIDPRIFGHFTEETLSSYEGGISSQLLYNRKFEIPEARSPGNFHSFGTTSGWDLLEADSSVSSLADRNVWYSPSQSLRISRTKGKVPAGIQQSGYRYVMPHLAGGRIDEPFSFKRGESYHVRVALRSQDSGIEIHVALGESWRKPVAEHVFRVASSWKVYECDLNPSSMVSRGKFMVYFDAPGTIWVDSVSMVRADLDEAGFRKDALDVTSRAKPTSIRWPGGWFVSDYNWKNGIGPIDQRPAEQNRAWLGYTTNDVGVDEYLALCKRLRAEPYICVNAGTGSAGDAAELVEYVNGARESKWGQVRARNGHPEPYRVADWNIGNEEYLPTIGGGPGSLYGERVLEFAKTMRAVDPSINLVAVGAFDMPSGSIPEQNPFFKIIRFLFDWNLQVLPLAGKVMDYYSIHHYDPSDTVSGLTRDEINQAAMVSAQVLSTKLARLQSQMERYSPGGKRFPIALDEWAVWLPKKPPSDAPQKSEAVKPETVGLTGSGLALRDALAEAAVYNQMQRRPRDFAMAHRTMLWGFAMGMIGISRDAVVASPSARMLELYSSRVPCESLESEVKGPVFDVPARPGIGGGFTGAKGAQYLDVSARRCSGSASLEVFVLNRNLAEDIEGILTATGTASANHVRVSTLNGSSLSDGNSFESPDRVRIVTKQAEATPSGVKYRFPAHSITVITVP